MKTSHLAALCLSSAVASACGAGATGQDVASGASASPSAVATSSSTPAATPPSASAPSSPSASASEPAWAPADAFLPPEAAARVESPGWRVDGRYEAEAGPLLDPCGELRFPRADAVVASQERAMASQREAGGSRLAQEVFRYASPREAADALDDYVDAVERCPERPSPQAPEGYTVRYAVVEQVEEDGVQRLLVRRQPCAPQDACPAHFRSYLLAAQSGDGVTVADYAIGEDGDPEDDARALLMAAGDQLASTVGRA